MKIRITEEQRSKLFEAAMEGFRLDAIASATSFNKRLAYCKQMLGTPIGNGSSRIVFQIDDETCLKLAKNQKGIQQNLREIELGKEIYLSCFPKVMNGTDEKNGLWIISECVLPLINKGKEFEEAYGTPFGDVQRFINITISCGKRGYNERAENLMHKMFEKYEYNSDATQLFNDIYELYYGYNHSIRDLKDYNNWGLTMRDGYPTFVILDAGLSDEIDKIYYKK